MTSGVKSARAAQLDRGVESLRAAADPVCEEKGTLLEAPLDAPCQPRCGQLVNYRADALLMREGGGSCKTRDVTEVAKRSWVRGDNTTGSTLQVTPSLA